MLWPAYIKSKACCPALITALRTLVFSVFEQMSEWMNCGF